VTEKLRTSDVERPPGAAKRGAEDFDIDIDFDFDFDQAKKWGVLRRYTDENYVEA
jgi:hypothetical protein